MKTIILYATKYGCTASFAKQLADKMSGAVLYNLKEGGVPSLDGFDCVILGASVYAGRMRKEMKEYTAAHVNELKTKRLGLFVSSLDPNGAENYLDSNLPKELVAAAKAKACFGGVYDKNKANWLERLALRIITKSPDSQTNILADRIVDFARTMQS